ncbi:NADH:ubiquinone reductase (Na(+)-transporting) subunit F [Psychromarinibacter sp. C21-152]|uniref:Na(+)-translocating NADH-quinone reductase subunit F n=1 Tax=Psychromarinibacter sediminicola TaxID=3033385 RepID=A0AAE3T8W8_9RHOB|nr:NADH:ubiquinone reductase (Na(+)-transporting) subunit F [Psychromarinibacter sediminicola]MDF0601865.1 NADH:ubiquinone reductase (Na(+)-transporting) subunit F [Psychromarinibacter sediminicola]
MIAEILIGSGVIVALVLLLTFGLLGARRSLVPQGAIEVTVNESQTIPAKRGDTLLSVLHGAGIPIPAGCGGSGTCGLCRVTAGGPGAGEAQATEKGILSAAERKAGVRLACQTTLRGPATVEVPADILSAETVSARVISNTMLAPLIRELVLDLPEGFDMNYRAGMFMQLSAPAYTLDFATIEVPEPFRETWQVNGWFGLKARSDAKVTRAYSIANRPEDAGRAVFNIRLAAPPPGHEQDIPPGIVSSYLFACQPGDDLDISGPFGEFGVQDTDREMVFIGGGVGMAPLRAMIHEQIGLGTHRKMSFFYGARSAGDLFYVDELDGIAAAHDNFTWTPALSDPAPGDRWTGATGFIHEIVRKTLSQHPAPEDCEYYLCGPPVMIAAVLTTLRKLGVERHMIHNDDFGA